MAELKVTITDERGNSESTDVVIHKETTDPTKATKQATPSTPEGKENGSKAQGMAIAAMIASKAFNYMTSNVGKYSGNAKAQANVNNAMLAVNVAAAACISPYLAIASLAIDATTNGIDIMYEKKWNERESSMRLAKAGYNSAGQVVGRRH